MPFTYENQGDHLSITGYDGQVEYLQIPERIGDIPVTTVAHSAFAHRKDIRYVHLPGTICRLERFAFYDCRHLERLCLSDGVEDYYDGVIGQCRKLEEIELDLSGGRYNVLRDLLGDSDQTIRFMLQLPDGTAKLTFPDYLTEYQEDTRARAIHIHIEGAGFVYRECVSRTRIDFRGYDRTFERIRYGDLRLASQIAMDRLQFPHALEEQERMRYEAFISENAGEAVQEAIRQENSGWLTLLTGRKLLRPEALQTGIRLASAQGLTEFVSILMASAGSDKAAGRSSFIL